MSIHLHNRTERLKRTVARVDVSLSHAVAGVSQAMAGMWHVTPIVCTPAFRTTRNGYARRLQELQT